MLRLNKLLVLVVLLVAITSFSYILLKQDPPIYKSRIVLSSRMRAVQDSMTSLRQIVERFEPNSFMNCVVHSWDSVLYFNSDAYGKLSSVSVSSWPYKLMAKSDVVHLVSLLNFLNQNRISGIVHDPSDGGSWRFPYGEDVNYLDKEYGRALFLVDVPNDTIKASFKKNYRIIDKKGNMLLVARVYYDKPGVETLK